MTNLRPKNRDWRDYPLGTRVHAISGGYWERVERGWKWMRGSTFPRPGGDAVGNCIELPEDTHD